MDDLWLGPAIGMQPGLLGGATFSVVLGIAASRRRLDELSLSKVVACGGVAGLLVGALPFAINKPPGEAALWLVGVVVMGSMTLLGAASAAAELIARKPSGLTVRSLVQRNLPAGYHQVEWDATDDSGSLVPAGPYWILYRAASDYRCRLLVRL